MSAGRVPAKAPLDFFGTVGRLLMGYGLLFRTEPAGDKVHCFVRHPYGVEQGITVEADGEAFVRNEMGTLLTAHDLVARLRSMARRRLQASP